MAPPQQLRQQTSNCSSLLTYRPQKDERLSWPSWLTYSGWFTHISVSGHLSAADQAQDSESTPPKDRCSTAGPCNQGREIKGEKRGQGSDEKTLPSNSIPDLHSRVILPYHTSVRRVLCACTFNDIM